MSRLSVLLAAVLLTAGAVCGIGWLTGWSPQPPHLRLPARWRSTSVLVRVTAAVAAGIVVAVVSGFVVFGLLAALLVDGIPAFFVGPRAWNLHVRRTKALAGWSRELAELTDAGLGLRKALAVSAPSVREPLRSDALTLAADVSSGFGFPAAARKLADALDDEEADQFVAALVFIASGRAGDVAAAMAELAADIEEAAESRQRVDTGRVSERSDARIVAVLSVAAVGLFFWINRDYLSALHSAGGQTALFVSGSVFVAGHRMLARMDRPPVSFRHGVPERFP